ncbi:MAG: glutaredoxin family protein [Gammaproteobacteria bacterium]|nr:glutaredoxin family protein [Gammaproteobacteria bacterium]
MRDADRFWCPYCAEARRWLEQRKVTWCEYNVARDRVGKKRYREARGRGIPVVLVGKETLHGFSADRLDAAIARSGFDEATPRR